MSDQRYHPGGPVEGGSLKLLVEPAGQCPNGHAQYRINRSPYVEHILSAADVASGGGALDCPHRLAYEPLEDG